VDESNSITPSKGEILADNQPKPQWTDIDWEMIKEHVNRLQTRIAKAVKQGKWNLVKRIRYLLTHSFYAKLLAVKRVTQNKGKRYPLQKAWYFDRIYRIYRMLTLRYILSILLILSNNF